MKSDVLGLVSVNHLARSDNTSPAHQDCIDLAALASNAVDFAKSGVPVVLPSELLKRTNRPDFMTFDPTKPKGYTSRKVLGSLFRLIEPPPKYEPSTCVFHSSSCSLINALRAAVIIP